MSPNRGKNYDSHFERLLHALCSTHCTVDYVLLSWSGYKGGGQIRRRNLNMMTCGIVIVWLLLVGDGICYNTSGNTSLVMLPSEWPHNGSSRSRSTFHAMLNRKVSRRMHYPREQW